MSRSASSVPRDFESSAISAEDELKTQTVGLLNFDDFRKRKRDVEDISGTTTPRPEAGDHDDHALKKKKSKAQRKLLSFENDDDDGGEASNVSGKILASKATATVLESTRPRVKPNPTSLLPAPKARTKASLAADAATRERLREQYVKEQESVRGSQIAIPFVFYDGSYQQGGTVKVKKGEQIWLFLERCRKIGAEMSFGSEYSVEGGASKKGDGKRSWARIGVDDLLLVRGDLIIPHHYEFYHFIANRIVDPRRPDRPLFDYSASATIDARQEDAPLRKPRDDRTEGYKDDPHYTKIVDRRWYEKNKHIYPASLWAEYKTGAEFAHLNTSRKDASGNTFFFS